MSDHNAEKGDGAESEQPEVQAAHISAWTPLREGMFRALWIASFVSNLGTWMHDVGAAWLMTTLRPNPQIVALLPAATNLAIFLLALPAGALADVLDRRRILLFTQAYLCLCTGVLAALTHYHLIGPYLLLAFTFLIAMGSAVTWPTWQAIMPELVPKQQVAAAIALQGVGWNLTRIIGPWIGGILVGWYGAQSVFIANSVSFLAVLWVLLFWRRVPTIKCLPEPVFGAMRTGFRFVRHSPELRTVQIRTGGVLLSGCALWALLPLHARQVLRLDATGYGGMMGWLGVGAVLGGVALPRLRRATSANFIINVGSLGMALHLILLAYFRDRIAVDAIMVAGGVFWTTTLLSFNIATLHHAPEWVRSRAAAIYLLVFTGATAVGSAFWGSLAEWTSIPWALTVAGGALLFTTALLSFWRMPNGEAVDHTPSGHWPEHLADASPAHDEGPVLVVVQYHVARERAEEFTGVMRGIRLVRLRNGAMRWDLFQDTASPDRWYESFLVSSWAEHLRQHQRMTVTDQLTEEQALSYHLGPEPPRVQHFLTRG